MLGLQTEIAAWQIDEACLAAVRQAEREALEKVDGGRLGVGGRPSTSLRSAQGKFSKPDPGQVKKVKMKPDGTW